MAKGEWGSPQQLQEYEEQWRTYKKFRRSWFDEEKVFLLVVVGSIGYILYEGFNFLPSSFTRTVWAISDGSLAKILLAIVVGMGMLCWGEFRIIRKLERFGFELRYFDNKKAEKEREGKT